MLSNEALPPAFLKEVVSRHKEEPKITEDAEDMEKVLMDFSESEAWEYLKRFIGIKRMELAKDVRDKSSGDVSLEEIGFRYLSADQVNTFATQIIDFVEKYARAREAGRDSSTDK